MTLIREGDSGAIFPMFFSTHSVTESQSDDVAGLFLDWILALGSRSKIPSRIQSRRHFFIFAHGGAETFNLMDQIFNF